MKLNSFKEIMTLSEEYTYNSPSRKIRYIWTFIFGLVSGDLNPVHINFLTSGAYKSKFKGHVRHGISSVAQAESYIFKALEFEEPTEVLSKGYNRIEYKNPVRIGEIIHYTFKLSSKKIVGENKFAECVWLVEGWGKKELLFSAEWIILYFPVELRTMTWVPPIPGAIPIEITRSIKDYINIFLSYLFTGITIYLFYYYWNRY